MLLQLVHGLLALPGLFLVLLGALGEPAVLLVHLVYELLQMLRVYGIRRRPFFLGRGVVLGDALVDLPQHTLYLLLQFRLVRQGGLLPNERVLVGYRLYLCAVNVLYVKAHLAQCHHYLHYLNEQAVHAVLHVL